MESKKINQLATELAPELSDLTIIGDPTTGISKKITLSQMASLFTGTVEEYASLSAFPLVGVADTIYIALDTNIIYRWNTSTNAYVELSPNIVTSLVFNDANGFDGTISLVGSTATLTITTALTTGSVGFIGASGALLQDNANFFWDNSNKRLGINTNAPTTALDVFGSGIIGRVNGTSTNNAFLGFASAGSNKWSIGNVQSDHRFRIYNEATTSELVSVLQTGEFGIGIANPTTKLHIDGGASALIANLDANVSVAKSISFRSDNSARINLEVSGTESGSNAGADLFIRTYTDAGALLATPFTILRSSGNIGIRTSTPTKSLEIVSNTSQDGIKISGSSNPRLTIIDTTNNVQFDALTTDTEAVLRTDSNHPLYLSTNGTARLIISATGNIGIGTSTPSYPFEVSNSGSGVTVGDFYVDTANNSVYVGRQSSTSGDNSKFYVRNRVNTLTALSVDPGGNGAVDVVGTFSTTRGTNLATTTGNVGIGLINPQYSLSLPQDSKIGWNDAGNTKRGSITVNSSGDAMVFTTGTSDAERMRVISTGEVLMHSTSFNSTLIGQLFGTGGDTYFTTDTGQILYLNRKGNDGTLVDFRRDNSVKGTISVSGETVSYNSFLGSHWSQLIDNSKPEILKGTVLEAIDELCHWENEINDRLPKVKISDTIESKNVYGIFLDWDNDDTENNDMYVAAVGAGYIRINKNEVISMGDLLQSNGDGTAKVQSDDLMRSTTIAKVISTNKIETYKDGSYLIAATLHCG